MGEGSLVCDPGSARSPACWKCPGNTWDDEKKKKCIYLYGGHVVRVGRCIEVRNIYLETSSQGCSVTTKNMDWTCQSEMFLGAQYVLDMSAAKDVSYLQHVVASISVRDVLID